MIVAVVKLSALACHDTPCAAVVGRRGRHRIFAIVAVRLARQPTLAVAEDDAIALEREGPAFADELHRPARLRRQLRQGDRFDLRRRFARLDARGRDRKRSARKRQGEGREAVHRLLAILSARRWLKRSATITWRSCRPAVMASTPSC